LYAFAKSDAFEDEKFVKRFEVKKKYILSHGNALTNENVAINGQIEKIAEHFLNGYVVKDRIVRKEDWEEFLNKIMGFSEFDEIPEDKKEKDDPAQRTKSTTPQELPQVAPQNQSQQPQKKMKIPKINIPAPISGTIPLVSYTPEEIQQVLQFQVKNDPHPLILFMNIILAATEKHEEVNERYEENMHYVEKCLERAWADRHSPEEAESNETLRYAIMLSMFAMYFALLAVIRKVPLSQLTSITPANYVRFASIPPLLLASTFFFETQQYVKNFISSIDLSSSEDGEPAEVFRKEISLRPPGLDNSSQDKPISPPSPNADPASPPAPAVEPEPKRGGLTIIVEAALDQPIPPPFRWKGASEDNPFTRQRFVINHIYRPLVDGLLFYAFYLPYLRLVTSSNLVSHSIVTLVYMLTRHLDESDPYQVLHKVPPMEAAVTDLYDTLRAQLLYFVSLGSRSLPVLFHVLDSIYAFVEEYVLQRELGKLPPHELVDPMLTALEILVSSDHPKVFENLIATDFSSLKNPKPLGELRKALPREVLEEVPNASKIIEDFADEAYHLFSSDHFSERDRQTLSVQDLLNFAASFVDYKSRRLQKECEEEEEKRKKKNKNSLEFDKEVFRKMIVDSLLEKYPEHPLPSPERQEWFAARFASLWNSQFTKLLEKKQPQPMVMDKKQFRVLVQSILTSLPPAALVSELQKIERSLAAGGGATRGNDLYQWMSYYENVSIDPGEKVERLLDLVQDYYQTILHADEIVLKEFEPELLQDFRERVMGRLVFPSVPLIFLKNERENFHTRIAAHLQAARDRLTGQLLLRHGLTLSQFEYLLSKFSSTRSDNEIDHLINDWHSYFQPSPETLANPSARCYPKVLKEKLVTGQLADQHHQRKGETELGGMSVVDEKVLATYRKLLYTDEHIQNLVKVRRLGDRR
jgi:hypothetical protein